MTVLMVLTFGTYAEADAARDRAIDRGQGVSRIALNEEGRHEFDVF